MFTKRIVCFVLLAICTCVIGAYKLTAQPAFYNDVQALKQKDKVAFPPANSILFTGSSSFTKWTDVQSYFPGYPIVNRAFGGSTLTDLIHYANQVVMPYHAKQIVIYCGDNDLAAVDSITPETVKNRFVQLFGLIRNSSPKASILYVSIKPSPSRSRLMPKMVATNRLISNFLKTQVNTAYADVYSKMLLPNGKPNPQLFTDDSLHMNAKGYDIWQKVLYPYLLK